MTKDELIRKLEDKRAKCESYSDKFYSHNLKEAASLYVEALDFAIGLVEQLEPETRSTTQTWDLP